MRFLRLMLLMFWPGLTLAQPITITDSRGPQSFDSTPKRVIAGNWMLAEMLLELDIVPVGIADLAGYNKWVVAPEMPETVADIGLRSEPNLEVVIDLKPDLILLSDDGLAMAKQAARIAPVLHFDAYSDKHDNIPAGRNNFRTLAKLFGQERLAEAKLAAMDARLAEQAKTLKEVYGDDIPQVTLIRFLDEKRAVIYGENSPAFAALSALGLRSEIEVPKSKWGVGYRRVRKLGSVTQGKVMYFEPFDQQEQLFDTALWQAMPFVQSKNLSALPAIWSYGGPLTVGRVADAIFDALIP